MISSSKRKDLTLMRLLAHRPVSILEPNTLHFPCLCTCEHITLLKTVLIDPGGAGPRMAALRGATPDGIERPFNNLLRRLSAG
ncbi:MAG TPA: hypothetical protein VK678_11470, partial [Bradyrhizobium sp.]|nr:hypothetical protein [Bradyrhizobium sp.]